MLNILIPGPFPFLGQHTCLTRLVGSIKHFRAGIYVGYMNIFVSISVLGNCIYLFSKLYFLFKNLKMLIKSYFKYFSRSTSQG